MTRYLAVSALIRLAVSVVEVAHLLASLRRKSPELTPWDALRQADEEHRASLQRLEAARIKFRETS